MDEGELSWSGSLRYDENDALAPVGFRRLVARGRVGAPQTFVELSGEISAGPASGRSRHECRWSKDLEREESAIDRCCSALGVRWGGHHGEHG